MGDKTDGLVRIFQLQSQLQARLGYDFETLADQHLVEYIRVNILALSDELHEALNETHWKPWASSPPGFKDRDKFAGELIDAIHFLVNLCLAAGMTPDELIQSFEAKNAVNHARQDRGYSGTDKCDRPGCGRALDEPSIVQVVRFRDWRFCTHECMLNYIEEEELTDEDLADGVHERAERLEP